MNAFQQVTSWASRGIEGRKGNNPSPQFLMRKYRALLNVEERRMNLMNKARELYVHLLAPGATLLYKPERERRSRARA